MNIFDTILLQSVFVLFPMLVYFFSLVYIKNIELKEKILFLDIALTISIYFILRHNELFSEGSVIALINVPILIAYLYHKKTFAIIMSSFLLLYVNCVYDLPLLILLIEYGLYFLFYYFFYFKNNKKKLFIVTVVTSKIILEAATYLLYNSSAINSHLFGLVISILTYLLVTYTSLYLLKNAEKMLDMHITMRELEKDKQIRNSLFKITHEIKNPLAVCKGYLDMSISNTKKIDKYIPIIKEEIDHALLILQDFLSLNKIKLENDILDINMLIDDVITCVEPVLKEKKIEAIYEIDDEEIFVFGDYYRLKQVMINIIKNSMEALEEKENKWIKVYAKTNKNKVTLFFEDNGPGINKSELKKVKDPFFTTKKYGTGMGIYLSDEIIKAHDGELIFDSLEGAGTTVKIVLNIKDI